MDLRSLLKEMDFECIKGNLDISISDIIYDSRNVINNSVFVCISGSKTDGHEYIDHALKQGAIAIVVEKDIEVEGLVTVIRVKSTRKALAFMSAAFFGKPANDLITIAVTGTKGKTTTTYMIREVLEMAGKKAGLIGTNGVVIGEKKLPLSHTTPMSYDLHKMFREMVDTGCQYVVMEASSQGFKMDRTAGIFFDYGIFTNFSPDHIGPGEHENLQEYLFYKSMLFSQCKTGIVNKDDENWKDIVKNSTCELKSYGIDGTADLIADTIEFIKEKGRIGITFKTKGEVERDFRLYIPGKFSVYNALATISLCNQLGIKDGQMANALGKVQVKGRVELVPVSERFTVLIDYAHNEVSTRSILETLKAYNPGRLVCVFGSGGNRSKLRRMNVGKAVSEYADFSVLTSDNSRDEEVSAINHDIKEGLKINNGKYVEIENRKEAIRYAIENAQDNDMIVLLGKGHEDYQEIKGIKYHFDEREVIEEIKQELGI